jgi:hypothetical protein
MLAVPVPPLVIPVWAVASAEGEWGAGTYSPYEQGALDEHLGVLNRPYPPGHGFLMARLAEQPQVGQVVGWTIDVVDFLAWCTASSAPIGIAGTHRLLAGLKRLPYPVPREWTSFVSIANWMSGAIGAAPASIAFAREYLTNDA